MSHKTVCELRDLTYVYPGEAAGDSASPRPALRGVSLSIREGEWLALLGANGSGKSTLAKHLNALLVPSQGECIVYGLDAADEKNACAIRSSVAMVFQNPENQIVGTVVEEDTAFGPENQGAPSGEIVRRVEKALGDAGLLAKRKKPTYTLSGGEKQRLAVAGALAMDTPCLVLDEPTAMLDPQGRSELLDVLEKLHRSGKTIVYITHRLEEIVRCDRAVILHEGAVAWEGPVTALFLSDLPLKDWGIDAPPLFSLWRDMKSESRPVPPIPTVASMADALCL
ncbi:MAG: ATP-binding cassette domain-containing protein [Aminivibrio sp.]|jgi:energy-coupling factor transport system ATP-binding protein|nr:ATP-binding cassette domain-containing protein [Synergistaceae bacterium]